MAEAVTCDVDGDVGLISTDSPPVNALGYTVRRGLAEGISRFVEDASIRAIVILCGGRTFFAGADISEFGKPLQHPALNEVFDIIEGSAKPVIAAIHGTALGGGLELALVCNYRIAVGSARFGLPEVKLGLLPGAGGTQRLPRIVGAEAALDLITSGRQIGAAEALETGVVDALAQEGALRTEAIAFVRRILAEARPLQRVRDREEKLDSARRNPGLFNEFRKQNARAFRGFPAPENIIKAIEAAVTLPFDEGMKRERDLFLEIQPGIQSQALRYVFFAERESSKVPDISASTPVRTVRSVGVIGAGTMGGGIAINFLNLGMPVTLTDVTQAALERGMATIRRTYDASARKGKLTSEQVEERMALITPAVGLEAIGAVDLIIEAAFEQMDIKQSIFRDLDRIAKPDAILATNTSFLDLNAIAAVTARPSSVVGLHFFSPANVMRLLEVVRGDETAPEILATVLKLAKTIGKVPVVSGVCHGFIANRVMSKRGQQADAIILEGLSPAEVDKAMYDYGFAMGPFQMIDLVGLDVIGRGNTNRTVRSELVRLGRLGQKSGSGYYDYDAARVATPSPIVTEIIAMIAQANGVRPNAGQSQEDILHRLLFPVVNEGAKLLEEGIALRASDIDIAAISGFNWPAYTGGPMFWADQVGLPRIVAALEGYEARYGEDFRPADLLKKLAREGGKLTG